MMLAGEAWFRANRYVDLLNRARSRYLPYSLHTQLHLEAAGVLCDLLRELGYVDVVETFEELQFWPVIWA